MLIFYLRRLLQFRLLHLWFDLLLQLHFEFDFAIKPIKIATFRSLPVTRKTARLGCGRRHWFCVCRSGKLIRLFGFNRDFIRQRKKKVAIKHSKKTFLLGYKFSLYGPVRTYLKTNENSQGTLLISESTFISQNSSQE